uniref:Metallo-beta-lactamase domain-containing protein n=1 Tax=Vitis vinifera TaxID=29760 RepID=A5BN04_VITVI|nr:hypothetical protein VITISV_006256 [Vitis vinifera]
MVPFLGSIRANPSSITCFSPYKRRIFFDKPAISVSRYGSSPFQRLFRACLESDSAKGNTRVQLPVEQSEIIFLGTGTSEGIPRVSCLTNPLKTCLVCSKAADPSSKNRRLNTSILIRYPSSSGGCTILIDVGKFFYHSALRWFPTFGLLVDYLNFDDNTDVFIAFLTVILFYCFVFHHMYLPFVTSCISVRIRTIDAVIITHSHADAIGGLDDLRDWTNNVQPHIPIYVAPRDFEVMKKTHYYLVDTSVIIPGAAVSELQFNIIHEEPFIVHDLKVIPLPVWHGPGYRSLGFRFGNICYISDVSEIPEETYPLLKNCEILVLALDEVRKIQPKRTLFTGMMHLMDHEKVSEDLEKLKKTEGLDVQLSYDGLRVPVTL